MREFERICVFCGSSGDVHPAYIAAARAVGRHLAEREIDVVYGGASVGLMGAVADAALGAGGRVYGVIPEKLEALEVSHRRLTELHVVADMHARKALMADLSCGFIALPGGFGTLEETCEVTTWAQLNYHLKPVGLLNVRGFYDQFIGFIGHAIDEGFIRPVHRHLMCADDDIAKLLDHMARVHIPKMEEWAGDIAADT